MSGFVAPLMKADDVHFSSCRLDDASMRMVSFARCAFDECDLRRADFYESRLIGGRLFDCNLQEADVRGVRFDQVALHRSRLDDLRGADALRGTIISSEQVMTLAFPVLHALGITIDDEYPTDTNPGLDG
jgi:uncharacterized protein YjbI with pentapeptide repeats